MAAGNWFDAIADNEDSEEIEVIDGYFSVNDTAGEILSNEECMKIVKGWLMTQGNLTLSSMLTTVRDMMGFSDLVTMLNSFGAPSQKDLAQLNRQLNKIAK